MSGQRETSFLINDSKQAQRLRSGEVSGRVERLFGVEVELKAPSETAAGSQQQQEGHWVTLRTSDGDRGSTEEAKVRSSVAIILSYVNTRVMCDSVCVCVVHGPKRALWRWFVWKLELQKGSHRFPTSLQFPKQAQHLCMCTVYTRSSCTCMYTYIHVCTHYTFSLSRACRSTFSLCVGRRLCRSVPATSSLWSSFSPRPANSATTWRRISRRSSCPAPLPVVYEYKERCKPFTRQLLRSIV